MKWLIVIATLNLDPWGIQTLKFDTKNECVEYVNNVENADVIAIEVIAKGGFDDRVTAIMCLPENNNMIKIRKKNVSGCF